MFLHFSVLVGKGRVGSRGQQGGAETKSGNIVPPRVYLALSSARAWAGLTIRATAVIHAKLTVSTS